MNRRKFLGASAAFAVSAATLDVFKFNGIASADNLDDLLASAQPGETVFLPPKTLYIRDYSLYIPDGVTLDGGFSVLQFLTDGSDLPPDPRAKNAEVYLRTRGHIKLGNGATVRRLRLKGANTGAVYNSTLEAQHGINFTGNGLAEDITIENVFGDFFYARGDNNVARRIRSYSSGRMGIGWTDGLNFLVEDCSLDRCARSVVDLEPIGRIGEAVDGFIGRRLTVGSYGVSFSGGSGGAVAAMGGSGPVSNVLFEDIDMLPGSNFIVAVDSVSPRTNLTFRRCKTEPGTKTNRQTYSFTNAHNVIITEAYQEFGGKGDIYAVKATASTDINVMPDCQFPGATGIILNI